MGIVHSQAPPIPDSYGPSVFDPMIGFPEGRKERVMHVTKEQMQSARLKLSDRGYCAHKIIDMKICVRKNYPCTWRCHHERHALDTCRYEDEILRFKEYERERRLLERQAKKERIEA